jgi:hypothetical protein
MRHVFKATLLRRASGRTAVQALAVSMHDPQPCTLHVQEHVLSCMLADNHNVSLKCLVRHGNALGWCTHRP